MNKEESLHQLLPWYVAGTLDPEEEKAFEMHLGLCPDCAREHGVWIKFRKTVERLGESLFEGHPTPEALVAATLDPHEPRPAGHEMLVVERHLAVCPTCAEEARWIRGESQATAGAATVVPMRRAWIAPLIGAAAGFLLAAALWLPGRGPRVDDSTALIAVRPIPAATRDSGGPTDVAVAAGAAAFQILIDLEIGSDAFPVRLVIERADGRSVYSLEGIKEGELLRGRFLFVGCAREEFPDGDYVAKVASAHDGNRPTEYPFRVRTR